jgi:GTP 3',8-cyclase
MDPFGRNVDYLRISITDRCNERCLYCLPEGFKNWQQRPDLLTHDEIVRVVRVATQMGFRKFRLTGGEPLVRTGVPELVRDISTIPEVQALGLSTNGTLLAPLAQKLRDAGLRTVNISLDALSPELYQRITGGPLSRVLEGIEAALAAGFECVKLNCVLMRHLNEAEIWPLVHYSAKRNLTLRFIELMPVTRTDVLSDENFLPVGKIMSMLRERDELIPQDHPVISYGPARYYRLKQTGALVGFIGAITNLHFCESCNRMRLTADGKIRPCLGNHGEISLKSALRNGLSDEILGQILLLALDQKPREHQFRNQYEPCRHMTAIGG